MPIAPRVPGTVTPRQTTVVNGVRYYQGLYADTSYATPEDLFSISIPVDDAYSYQQGAIDHWLGVGAAKINEWLGQRFNLPLQSWSQSVVWANCELAYLGLTLQRGTNTEADSQAWKLRDAKVSEWMRLARDHEITPGQRLIAQEEPYQPVQYVGPSLPTWGQSWSGGNGSTGGPGFGSYSTFRNGR